MPDTARVPRPSANEGDLVSRLPLLTLAVSQTEYHAATILAFDPEAFVPAGQLAAADEPRDHRLGGDAMALPAWRVLARACSADPCGLVGDAALTRFLAERSVDVGILS